MGCRRGCWGFSAYLWGIETRKVCWMCWLLRSSFQHTYEGLKLDPLPLCVLLFPLFSAYLWGIETLKKVFRPEKLHSFQHTYEGLKLWNSGNGRTTVLSFQHTYEGLKQNPYLKDESSATAFSAYLWGIETNFKPIIYPVQFRFQHTYEGLKPRVDALNLFQYTRFSAYLWGIETIGCRQQQTNCLQFSAYLWGIETQGTGRMIPKPRCFQHTYEGLKPRSMGFSTGKLCLFSAYLWGIETWQGLYWPAGIPLFSAYLWGIETQFPGAWVLLPPPFSAYLWGIETQRVWQTHSLACLVFSIPMRDWNFVPKGVEMSMYFVFSIPMRDWNKPSNTQWQKWLWSFQHTYEGLKQIFQ